MNGKRQRLIVGLGELLWDLLPGGKQLGGAPANFAVMSARLGNHAVIASRIGQDVLGEDALKYLSALPVDSSYLQTDTQYATGSVSVALRDGQPEYNIHRPVAWDFLECTSEWIELAQQADAVCFGTLAQRNAVSRKAIGEFLDATSRNCVRVFDVNLRKPFFNADVLADSLTKTSLLKLNDAEMPVVLSLLGLTQHSGADERSLLAGARLLLARFPLQLICITMGSHGSLLVTRDAHDRHRGLPVKVVDTVGAGDAFTAALVHFFLQGAPLPVLNEAGNRWGAWVASQPGAMPALPVEVHNEIEAKIKEAVES
ncbi:MAG TPA: carbohydrate kinase [Pseudacidobacterium sp.]|nr:carbohydrate kinase [Pseudacidobacterium sp.]